MAPEGTFGCGIATHPLPAAMQCTDGVWQRDEPFACGTLFKRPLADAATQRFFEISAKISLFENWSKSAPGSVLGRFMLEIRILREKLYRDVSSNQYFYKFDFWLFFDF